MLSQAEMWILSSSLSNWPSVTMLKYAYTYIAGCKYIYNIYTCESVLRYVAIIFETSLHNIDCKYKSARRSSFNMSSTCDSGPNMTTTSSNHPLENKKLHTTLKYL